MTARPDLKCSGGEEALAAYQAADQGFDKPYRFADLLRLVRELLPPEAAAES